MADLITDKRIWFGKNGDSKPRLKRFRSEVRNRIPPQTLWGFEQVGHTDEGTKELAELLGGTESPVQSPKPSRLVRRIVELSAGLDAIVLDFFAGSGTTAQAILDSNKQDGGNRKFILVQLPELTMRDDYPTIAEITKERVRRVIKNLNDGRADKLDLEGNCKQDLGFRTFKLAESNFNPWDADIKHDGETLEKQLELHVEHIRDGRSENDILYEILLKSGFRLTTTVETLTLEGKTVYSVSEGAMLVCLERELTLKLIRAIAAKKPERVVCLDQGFEGNDQLKTNAVQTFKTKGVTSFRTI